MSFQQFYLASGWTQRGRTESEARQILLQWLTQNVAEGSFDNRTPMLSPWQWCQTNNPVSVIRNTPVSSPRDLDYSQTLWNFMEIPGLTNRQGQPFSTKGYVTCRDLIETPHRGEPTRRGFAGGPFRPDAGVSVTDEQRFKYWEAIRRLPDTEQEMRDWGYQWSNPTERRVIQGYCQQYNQTLHARLTNGYSAGRAHSSAVSSLRSQATQLLWQAMFDLALSAGGSAGMNFAPFFGDFASRMQDIQTR